jgi:N-acetylglucosaminyldiphosphoundecaprenol N-acetyl-beta-D-mannosaminyltransferase
MHMTEVDSQYPKKFTVFGLPVHLLNDYPDWLLQQLHQQNGVHVVTLNAEMSMQAEHNQTLADVIRQAELVIPDGAGIVFYLWLQGKKTQRCPGIELAETLLRRSVAATVSQTATSSDPSQPYSIFFYGGSPGVSQTAAEVWQRRLPGLAIAGTQHGYLSTEEQASLRQTLKTLHPDIILVGLGVPRQELWIAENRHLCPNAIWIGVGGSFDIWAGTKTRAPQWLRNNSLEWIYRLYQEPWRWRRMLALPKFAWRALIYSWVHARRELNA